MAMIFSFVQLLDESRPRRFPPLDLAAAHGQQSRVSCGPIIRPTVRMKPAGASGPSTTSAITAHQQFKEADIKHGKGSVLWIAFLLFAARRRACRGLCVFVIGFVFRRCY